ADGVRRHGVQAVIDKDLVSAVLAAELGADMFVILTDADYVTENWGTPEARGIRTASVGEISQFEFAAGSMGPKVMAAVQFARTGGRSLIGPLDQANGVLTREVGTEIRASYGPGIEFAAQLTELPAHP